MPAFASLLLCSIVAGVLSPWLSGSMLQLALGASALTASGVFAWWWYRRLTHRRLDQAMTGTVPATTLQAEIAELG